jgi:hypothetical protein
MEWTHKTYEETVKNPECEPRNYNPYYQFHNAPSWVQAAKDRPGYESACMAAGITAQTDDEIRQKSYGIKFAEFTLQEWHEMSRAERVAWKISEVRLVGIEEEKAALAHTAKMHKVTGLGVSGPGGIYKPDAVPTRKKCARCGAPAMWIAGAGEALCARHQDDY